MKKLNLSWNEIKEKSTVLFKNLFNVAVITTSMVIGFFASQLYTEYKKSKNSPITVQETQTLKNTSVAINERGELMVIDRQNGKYIIYDGEVGNVIFQLYASKIYYDQKTK